MRSSCAVTWSHSFSSSSSYRAMKRPYGQFSALLLTFEINR